MSQEILSRGDVVADSPEPDPEKVEAFAGRLFGVYTDTMLNYMIDLGHRLGLFEALAQGPATCSELADRAGVQERYVREWFGSVVTGRIAEYDPITEIYRLPPEHAACLTGAGSANLASFSQFNTYLGKYVEDVAGAFRTGGGVPYTKYRPEFAGVMDSLGRGVFDEQLIDSVLPLASGVPELLAAGARAADVACGTGHALALMAEQYPASVFVGYDFDQDAIERARDEAAEIGLSNVEFELLDVAKLTVTETFDVAFSFDAIHDQADPARVLRNIFAALKPGGVYLMKEPRVSSHLHENVENPFAPLLYAVSTLHCLTVSLADGGAGLGTAWGEQVASSMLSSAGFTGTQVSDAPGDPIDAVFVSHKPLA